MDTQQQAALAQYNETRPRRGTSPMAVAEEAHRVALADAHDAYVAALAAAAMAFRAAADRADRALALAKEQQQAHDRWRASMADYYVHRPEGFLVHDLRRFLSMVSPGYLGHRDRTQDEQARMHADLISAELERRGVDVS